MENNNSRKSSSSMKRDRFDKEDHQSQSQLTTDDDISILPLIDVIHKLGHLNVMDDEEGIIQLSTIVVVGDRCSGRSSVVESLTGIRLPTGISICTRVPLIMKLESHSDQIPPILQLEYHGKVVQTDELNVSKAISDATEEIAGKGECISNTPLTLVIKKKGVLPDLTIVDLPGITRRPVGNQPEDIYEQVSSIIMEYISPKEIIILNVLPASSVFGTYESICMSKEVDQTGERTLAVVTKVDKDPEEVVEKITAGLLGIGAGLLNIGAGLGYVCVRNRIRYETCEEARVKEALLFQTDPHLSKIDKSIVGIPVLAQKLIQIQARAIYKRLPNIVSLIRNKLKQNKSDLGEMPTRFTSEVDTMNAFFKVISSVRDSLSNIFITGDYKGYQDDMQMHCQARLAQMLRQCNRNIQSKSSPENDFGEFFLQEECMVLEESDGSRTGILLSQAAFTNLLRRQIDKVADIPREYMENVWKYVKEIVEKILMEKLELYPKMQSLTIEASNNLMFKMKTQALDWVRDMVHMETFGGFTCDPDYAQTCNRLMGELGGNFSQTISDTSKSVKLKLGMFGEVDIGHLRGRDITMIQLAFELKIRMSVYWNIARKRIVDTLNLFVTSRIDWLITEEMQSEILNEIANDSGGGYKRMMEQCPSVVNKRRKLNDDILLLEECQKIVADVIITAQAE